MSNFALLDYDGFVCKAFYAAAARGDMEDASKVLKELTDCAIDKACSHFKDDVKVIKVMSGHSYKKDLYPDYKANRKKDPYIGIFREQVLESDNTIVKCDSLEADDVLVLMYEILKFKRHTSVVFSDDKDLRYYCPCHCKININEDVETKDYGNQRFVQMLTGDKEDNIKGIPKVGQKTAEKLLTDDASLEHIAKIYRNNSIDEQEAIKQVVLVTPLCLRFATHLMFYEDVFDALINNYDEKIQDIIMAQLDCIKESFGKVYNGFFD